MAFGGRNPPANAGDVSDGVQSLGWEDPLEEGMATHSGILAWRIPWTDKLGSSDHRIAKSETTEAT